MAFRESTGSPVANTGGIMMGGDGPMMSGTWVNPKTGHKFTVRDCFFQDGNFMVQTTAGQMLDYNTIQHYVQSTGNDAVPIQKQQAAPKKQAPRPQPQEVPEDIMNEILPEDMEAIGLGNINDPVRNKVQLQPVNTQPMPVVPDPDAAMVDRVLNGLPLPKLSVNVDWEGAPKKQIETLVQILRVKPQSIINYYISKLNMSVLGEAVREAITEYVSNLAEVCPPSEPPTVIEDPEIGDPVNKDEKPRTVKKKVTKKTKK